MWPILLGLEKSQLDLEEYIEHSQRTHRDSSVVDCDVDRSLWSYTEGTRDHPYNYLRVCSANLKPKSQDTTERPKHSKHACISKM